MATKDRPNKIRKYLWFAIFITNLIAIILLIGATQAWDFLPSKAPIFSFSRNGISYLGYCKYIISYFLDFHAQMAVYTG